MTPDLCSPKLNLDQGFKTLIMERAVIHQFIANIDPLALVFTRMGHLLVVKQGRDGFC